MKKLLAIMLCVVLALGVLAGCGSTEADKAADAGAATDAKVIASSADLAGAKVAVQEGTTGDLYVTDKVEGAEVSRFKRAVDAGMDLKNGKVDAVVIDDQVAKDLVAEIEGLKILPEALTEEQYAIAMTKDDAELVKKLTRLSLKSQLTEQWKQSVRLISTRTKLLLLNLLQRRLLPAI